jgi:hypothetical protein
MGFVPFVQAMFNSCLYVQESHLLRCFFLRAGAGFLRSRVVGDTGLQQKTNAPHQPH